MDYVKLGRTGLDVSRICLGCMSYGGGNRGKSRLVAQRGGEQAFQAESRFTFRPVPP
jgi:aryl-alcohol dehydrogenase-like predicted oxidoreductase